MHIITKSIVANPSGCADILRFATLKLIAVLCASLLLGACGGGSSGGNTDPVNNPTPPGNNQPVLITSFSPDAGKIGTRVQIEGLLFGNNASNNAVTFNGVSASIVAADFHTIVVDVPVGASTGPVQVTTASATAISSKNFTVITDTTTPGLSWTARLKSVPVYSSGSASNGAITIFANGNLFTSTDNRYWKDVNLAYAVNDVYWDGQMFVAVGSSACVYTSSSGILWTQQSLSNTEYLTALTKTGSTWVAVGNSGLVRTSINSIDWVTQTTPTSDDLRDIAWNGTTLTAVGVNGTIMTSTDEGVTWTQRNAGTTNIFTAVATNGSLFVASTDYANPVSGQLFSSPDGITWTPRQSVGYVDDIIYVNGQWLAVGNNRVYSSTDAITWTLTLGSSTNHINFFNSIVHTGSEFIAAGGGLTLEGDVYRSVDGLNWLMIASSITHRTISRSPIDGRLVVSNYTGQTLMSMDDGVTWTFGDSGGGLITAMTWSNAINKFVGITQSGANLGVNTSDDGLSWTALLASSIANKGIASSDTLLVAVDGGVGSGLIQTSPDGANWTTRANPATYGLSGAIWTGSQFVTFGGQGNVLTSPMGTIWTLRNSGITAQLNDAAASPSLLVIVGISGTIITSNDNGVTWVSRNSGTTFRLNSVEWTGSAFVAVGNSGRTLRSTNGTDWVEYPNQFNNVPFMSNPYNFLDVVWNGMDRLITVGDRGLIATSP